MGAQDVFLACWTDAVANKAWRFRRFAPFRENMHCVYWGYSTCMFCR